METHVNPLAALNDKLRLVRDRVRGIIYGKTNGLYLCGRPGTAKTYTVRTTLEHCGAAYQYHSGHLTPIGLFDLLRQHHDRVVVLDDVSSIFGQQVARQILLAALGNSHDGGRGREVRYKRAKLDEVIMFTGGIVAISNIDLTSHDDAVLNALKDRINVLNYDPTDEEVLALCRDIAGKGIGPCSPKECGEVLEYLRGEAQAKGIRLSVRMFVDKAMADFRLCKEEEVESHWKDLIRSDLDQQLVELRQPVNDNVSRKEQTEAERRVVQEICLNHTSVEDRIRVWRERTSKSQAAYYRRFKELKKAGLLSE
jgi:flagellar capping protein FliD